MKSDFLSWHISVHWCQPFLPPKENHFLLGCLYQRFPLYFIAFSIFGFALFAYGTLNFSFVEFMLQSVSRQKILLIFLCRTFNWNYTPWRIDFAKSFTWNVFQKSVFPQCLIAHLHKIELVLYSSLIGSLWTSIHTCILVCHRKKLSWYSPIRSIETFRQEKQLTIL